MRGDLDAAVVTEVLGDRPVQAYPAVLSTEPLAMAWARQGARSGAVVVADYQASPRGRAGLPWAVEAGRGLGFTLVHRDPELAPDREGWPYVPALLGLQDVIAADDCAFEWPDTIAGADGTALARLGVYVELGPNRTEWTTITVLVEDVVPPRGPVLRRLVEAVEARLAQASAAVLASYKPRCTTLGRSVRARMLPLGPDGPEVAGEAVDVLPDGALVVLTARGHRVAVPPQNLGLLEGPSGPAEAPADVLGRTNAPPP